MAQKTLYLLRHAKAEPEEPSADDHERALAPRGIENARALGAYLRERGVVPKRVLCSTALRTRQTLSLIEEGMDRPLNATHESGLYLASPQNIIAQLMHLPDTIASVMIIGHNPSMHQLASDLVEEGNQQELDELSIHFPTCALAEIDLPIDSWADISPRIGTLRHFVLPNKVDA